MVEHDNRWRITGDFNYRPPSTPASGMDGSRSRGVESVRRFEVRPPEECSMSDFPALTHVALTVRNLSVSAPWYEALLASKPVLDEDTDPDFHHTVYLVGNTLLGLHQHKQPAPEEAFSEFRIGLDHVAFGCAN